MKKIIIAVVFCLCPSMVFAAAGQGISTWPALVDPVADGDLVAGTDVSDTSGSDDGTSVKITAAQLRTYMGGTFLSSETDPIYSAWDKDYADLINTPTIPTVSDTAYDATSWNGNTDAPTKNAVRDKIETIAGGSMTYPGAGLAVSTGSAWATSLTCSNDADVIEWDTTTSAFICVTPTTYTAGTSISLAGNQISVTGLVIGTNVQAFDADLTDLADGSLTASKVGNGYYVADDCTSVSSPATGAICDEY